MPLTRAYIFLFKAFVCLFLILGIGGGSAFSQDISSVLASHPGMLFSNIKINSTDSGLVITEQKKLNCKGSFSESILLPNTVSALTEVTKVVSQTPEKPKFLIIHGNISYDYFYRSKTDTPFNQQDLQQHTERVSLDILLKEKYPLKVSFSSRQSNSPFFRNFLDANFQFDRYGYQKNLKKILLDKIDKQIPERPDLKNAQAALKEEMEKLQRLKAQINDPGTLQKIIEEREKIYYAKIRAQKEKERMQASISDSLYALKNNKVDVSEKQRIQKIADSISNIRIFKNADSLSQSVAKKYEEKKAMLDNAEKKVADLKRKADSIKVSAQKDAIAIKQKIYKAVNDNDLRKIAAENGIATDKQSGLEKKLGDVKTLSVGRSVLNYTELTAQNIIITGINVEYNPSWYAAFAAGKIDYRFRDFFNKKSKNNNQYIALGRFGFGNKDKKAVIFTLFRGRKNQSEYAISDSFQNHVNIVGYSVETILKKDENTFLSAEFAKSTKPVGGNLNSNKQIDPLWKFDDRTNMGINFKGQTIISETNTKLSGFFRKTGENFQSFSLFSYNTDQTAWLARIDQSFLKNKIGITGMLRRNDFTNPFTEKTFKTSTVFKSVQVNVRFPKYPSLSFGYYPGSQLYIVDKETIRENAYYILNGSLVYSYFVKGIGMNTSLIYNRYMNKASDSGFVLYKGVNYYAAQTFFLKRLQLQGGYSYTKQPELKYYTLESSADYSLRKIFKFGAGIKYNKVYGSSNYWGDRLMIGTDLKKLGVFQFQYEKSYLPTISQTLYPVETGRVSWYKSF
jgi:hypothetical protein